MPNTLLNQAFSSDIMSQLAQHNTELESLSPMQRVEWRSSIYRNKRLYPHRLARNQQ